jgi:hypothetical protein
MDVRSRTTISYEREMAETEKERTDRQLIELLNELRVALPGAQILFAFLLAVPFATRFGSVHHAARIALYVCLLCTAAGTTLLMAPSMYHRLRWDMGGKSDVIRIGHRMFLGGTSFLGLGMAAAVYVVSDVLFGGLVAALTTAAAFLLIATTWYALPLAHGRSRDVTARE